MGEKAPYSSMQGKCTIAGAAEPLVARCCASTFQHSRVDIGKCLAGIKVNVGRRGTQQTGQEANGARHVRAFVRTHTYTTPLPSLTHTSTRARTHTPARRPMELRSKV